MLRLRPYKTEDAEKILSWSNDEKSFYKWSAGILGEYPITKEQFSFEHYTSMDVYKAVLENNVKNTDEFLILHECIQQD